MQYDQQDDVITSDGDKSNGVSQPARDVQPGECWAFLDHRTVKQTLHANDNDDGFNPWGSGPGPIKPRAA